VLLPSDLNLEYTGSTVGLANIVESSRLEWTDAPDDALLYVAPASGLYRLELTDHPSGNGGCGLSVQEFANVGTTTYYDENDCPGSGQVANIDGVYGVNELTLTQGQSVLIWFGCTYWSDAVTGSYTLTLAAVLE